MRKWVSPKAVEENFTSNQNVANSISGCFSVYCMISGDGKGKFNEKKYFNRNAQFYGNTIYADGKQHGEPCARGSSLDTKTNNYYEYNKKSGLGEIDSLGPQESNGYIPVTWTSTDIDGTGEYTHYGYAINDQPNKPNHS